MKTWWHKIKNLPGFLSQLKRSLPFRNTQLNFLERALGRSTFHSQPMVLQLEFTNSCNLKCITCGHSYWNKKLNSPRFLQKSMIDNLESILPSFSELLIGGYGEPTLHPDFCQLVNFFRQDEHLKISMITNGTLLHRHWSCLEQFNTIILSMDGVGDVYEKHRKIPFSKFVGNLDNLFRYRDGLSKGDKAWQGPFDVEVNLVWNKATHANMSDALNFLHKYPISRIHFLPEKMYDFSRKEESLFHLKSLHQVYTDIQKWQREFSMKIEFPNFLKHELPCNQPLDMVFLLSNGEMMACCSAIFHGHGHRFSLGNLTKYDGSFAKLWNQPSMKKFRKARFGAGDYPEPCKDCAFRFVNNTQLSRDLGLQGTPNV